MGGSAEPPWSVWLQTQILADQHDLDLTGRTAKTGSYHIGTAAAKNLQQVKDALEAVTARPSFVSFDENKMEGTLVRLPERDEMEPEIDEALVVEWYNKLL